ncbi:MAG: thymidine kinase [Deltaproteobacteria bacterium]|nr:thymidine kinase [Deltaproteobacteria bacterium]
MHLQPKDVGWIEVICGPMFSGKTEELIRRLKRAKIARQKVVIFKPSIDKRYHKKKIVSHSAQELDSIAVRNSKDIIRLVPLGTEVVGIDEAQFFDNGIVKVAQHLADSGIRVIIAGLDLDYKANPFGPMPILMCKAEYVTKNLAICVKCGNPASFTQRVSGGEKQILLGAMDSYEARCRKCFKPYVDN